MTSIPYFDAAYMRQAVDATAAVDALERTLRAGFDPATDPARSSVPITGGEFLLMPTSSAQAAGVKVVSVAPATPGRTVPRIQGVYILFNEDLTPVALMDGAALTTIRTPAVAVAAVRGRLERSSEPLNVVVFGAGVQGIAHLEAFAHALPRPIGEVTFIVRSNAPSLPEQFASASVVPNGSAEANAALAHAGLVICATTAREPLFDSSLLRDDVVVIAMGSHEPDARELDSALIARSDVIVEDVATALREGGDVIMAIGEGQFDAGKLITLRQVATGEAQFGDRPTVFKCVGMSWEDLAVATAIARS